MYRIAIRFYIKVMAFAAIPFVSSCVYADTVPASLFLFRIPPIEISGKLTLTNTEFDFKKETLDIHSWHFDKEQVHHLSNGKGMNLVIYHHFDSKKLSYWSQGTDDVFQSTLTDNAKSKNCYLLHQLSLIYLLKNVLQSLSTEAASTLKWTPSVDGKEGTLTLTKKTESPGYVMTDTDVCYYRDSHLISKDHYAQGYNAKKGVSEHLLHVTTQLFNDYDSVFSAIPMKGSNDYQAESRVRRLKSEWAYDRVTTIAVGLTAKQVVSDLTRDLVPDRWPSSITSQKLYIREAKNHSVKRFVWIGLTGVGILALLLFGVRYYIRARRP